MPSSEDSAGHNPSRVSIDNGYNNNNNNNNNKWCTYMREQLFGSLSALRVSNDHSKECSIILLFAVDLEEWGMTLLPTTNF